MPPQAAVAPSDQFLRYIKSYAAELRQGEPRPKTLTQWETQKRSLRKNLLRSWGGFPKQPCPLSPRKLGELKYDGYRVEKIVFQTRPGVWMTANAYVPDGQGKRPAVLCVHGHWSKAKVEPTIQSRCIGLAKLGFFVLAVDALGAGERGIDKPLGEYHGEMVAATLFPTGLPLSGLQVYENMRAVDYLQSRVEVDPRRLGITGASGGGNQTMYSGAFDERFGCVVPTCSVGNYQAYLGAACCMCEVVPGALTYTEEWGLLAMVAPRGLMVTSATRDSFQFSVGQAKISIDAARPVFKLHGTTNHIKHTIIESPHDYNQSMREAMYGWMTWHLKGEGKGEPIAEPKFETEDPETLRCFPGDRRPDDYVTLPKFAAAEGRKILKRRKTPNHLEQWETDRQFMTESLTMRVLGKNPAKTPLQLKVKTEAGLQKLSFQSEPGVTVAAQRQKATGTKQRLAILLDFAGSEQAHEGKLAKSLHGSGWDLLTADLRGTGAFAYRRDAVRRAPDHNTAEWSMWCGRSLLGQWVWDLRRLLDAMEKTDGGLPKQVALVGIGPAGLPAICTAAIDSRISQVATVGLLSSYVSDVPYEKQRLGIVAPGILRDAGDVPHLAALVSPRPLHIAGPLSGGGAALKQNELADRFAYTRAVYKLLGTPGKLSLAASTDPQQIVAQLG